MVSRIHRSWLAAQERRLLTWLAARLPSRVMPDHLTLLGVGGALLCGVSFWASAWSADFLWLACAGLAINWFGDSLDGSLARYRRTERPRYGFFVDHSTDVVSQTFIFMGLGLSPYMRFDMACLMLMSYWIAALYTFIRAVAVQIFQISYFGVGPTEIRLCLVLYSLAILAFGPLALPDRLGGYSLFDIVAPVVFIAVFGSFLSMVRTEARRLAALEAVPVEAPAAEPWAVGLEAGGEAVR